ncbi:MAG: 2-oxoacid:ferredoxin oxidoreductase subunit beta [Candidatus Bathyarchaeota archaeon]
MTVVKIENYDGPETAWCPGCGNFSILTSVKHALVKLAIPPYRVLIVSGIGQASKLPHYLKCNTFNGLHGRALPVATGAKVANHELVVLAVAGDGDAYGEGGNHFFHTMRRNPNITYMVHDNQVYGLTKGQASPTSDLGFITRTTPNGVFTIPYNPIALAIAGGASFVARSYSGNIEHLTEMIKQGVQHKGFAFIDILQPCVSFNHLNTYEWYSKRVYNIEDDEDYDPSDKISAFRKAQVWGDKIPIGIFYREERKTFEDQLPQLHEIPLIKHKLDSKVFEVLMDEFL